MCKNLIFDLSAGGHGLTRAYPMLVYYTKCTEFNNLSSSIPTDLGLLTEVSYLYFGGNALTGTIPTELGQLTQARELEFRKFSVSSSF